MQADQAREDFAQILDELDFVRSQIAPLPTKREVRWIALRLTLGALAAVVVALLLSGEPKRHVFKRTGANRYVRIRTENLRPWCG